MVWLPGLGGLVAVWLVVLSVYLDHNLRSKACVDHEEHQAGIDLVDPRNDVDWPMAHEPYFVEVPEWDGMWTAEEVRDMTMYEYASRRAELQSLLSGADVEPYHNHAMTMYNIFKATSNAQFSATPYDELVTVAKKLEPIRYHTELRWRRIDGM